MRITPINFDRSDEMVVACVLEDESWKTAVGGVSYEFPPFAQFRVSVDDGNYLIEKAQSAYEGRLEQAKGERNMWARKISSLNQRERDQALRFCDKDGNPITKPWPRVPLVSLNSEKGREIYQQVYDAAKQKGVKIDYFETKERNMDLGMDRLPDPDAGSICKGESRKFEKECYESNEPVPPSASPPVATQAVVEGPVAEEPKAPVKIPKPSDKWPEAELVKFAQAKGFAISKLDQKTPGKALDLAMRAHADHCRRLTAAGVQFEEV